MCGDPWRVPRLDGARRRDGGAFAVRPLPVGALLRDQQPARDDAARARTPRRRPARSSGDPRRRARVRHDRRQPLRRRRRRHRRPRSRVSRPLAAAARRAADVAVGGAGRSRCGARSHSPCSVSTPATGGSSHVTDAVGDGPAALAGDIADRIELSVRRTAASAGAIAVVLGSLAILAAVAFALRGTPCSTRSSSRSQSRSSSTTRPATCSARAPRSRSHLLDTHRGTAG